MVKYALAAVFAMLLTASLPAAGRTEEAPASMQQKSAITVMGQGSVEAVPDLATIQIGVSTEDGSPQAALAKNNASTAKIISELEASGIEKKDIRTSRFSIYPQFRNDKDGTRQSPVFHVSNSVTVTVRNLDRAGEILTKAVSSGSNQIGGANFTVSNPEKYLDEARKKAVQAAQSKAQIYAEAAGVKLGAVLAMSDESAPPVIAQVRSVAAFAKSASPVPVETGEQTLQAQVTMTFELLPGPRP